MPPRYSRQRIRSKIDEFLLVLTIVLFLVSIPWLAIAGWLGFDRTIPVLLGISWLILGPVGMVKSWIDSRKFQRKFKAPPLPESFEEALRKWWQSGTLVAEIPDFPRVYTEQLSRNLEGLFGIYDTVTVGRNFHLPNVGVEFGITDTRDQKTRQPTSVPARSISCPWNQEKTVESFT